MESFKRWLIESNVSLSKLKEGKVQTKELGSASKRILLLSIMILSE